MKERVRNFEIRHFDDSEYITETATINAYHNELR